MARRLINPTATRVAVKEKYEIHNLPAVDLVTIYIPRKVRGKRKSVEGKFVRFIPRPDCNEAMLEEEINWARNSGALSIKHEPLPRKAVVSFKQAQEIIEAIEDFEDRPNTIREVVLEMVERSNIAEELKDDLREYCLAALEGESDVHSSD